MHCRHRILTSFLLATTIAAVGRADVAPRRKCSWEEKDARVEVFSPDGRFVVSSGGDGFQLRDAGTGQVRAVLSPPGTGLLRKPVFTPDGRLLFAQVASRRSLPLIAHDLMAWDVATGRPRGSFPYVAEHLDEGSFELSRDGRWLAFVDNSARLPLDVKTSTIIMIGVHEVEISRNANPGLPRVKIWDVSAWKEIAVVDGGLPLAFSPDGDLLATGDRNWKTPVAKLWDRETGRLRLELKDRSPGLGPLAFSPGGRLLASSEHGAKSLWELADARRWAIETKGTGLSSKGPAFSPDGKLLFPNGLPWVEPGIGPGQKYDCFDLTQTPPRRLDLGPGEITISPDGRRYAALLGTRGSDSPLTVTLHDLPSLRESGRFEMAGLDGASFSPDGRWLALLAGRNAVVPPGLEPQWVWEIRLIDPATAQLVFTVPSPGQTWGNYSWKFSPDAKSLAVSYRTGSNVAREGEPDPSDRPMTVEIWELPPR